MGTGVTPALWAPLFSHFTAFKQPSKACFFEGSRQFAKDLDAMAKNDVHKEWIAWIVKASRL